MLLRTSADEKVFYRSELRELNTSLAGALPRARDRETRAHLQGARDQIARILDPKFATAQGGSAAVPVRTAAEALNPFTTPPDQLSCWPDYIIVP